MTDKLKDCFDEMVVYKDLTKSNILSDLALPSFLRDWLLKHFGDEEGNLNPEELTEFVHTYLPSQEEWVSIKDRIITDNERVKILTRINVDISIRTGEISFSLPDFGLKSAETVIEPSVWERYREKLVCGQEIWAIVELGYRPPNDDVKPKIPGKIRLTGFDDFCPYTVDSEYYKDVRSEFTTAEWIDVLLGAIDYNAAGYRDEAQKLAMLSRLLPFVEKRLNLLELAPKGTGKSYVFGHVSKYGLLVDGGTVTRAKMFYDTARKTPGFIVGNDFVVIDEVKLVRFGDTNEMRSALQGYMERGRVTVAGTEVQSDAGVVFLGNIDRDNMDVGGSMFDELPPLFRESALVDRIHGFIRGWDIPRMNDDLKLSGWALNSEYFCSVLHELRSDVGYRTVVDQIVEEPEGADTRDTEAVKRIATGFLKLLFPNVRSARDVDPKEFMDYCLRPASEMRSDIRTQLGILDKEYQGKKVPSFVVREVRDAG